MRNPASGAVVEAIVTALGEARVEPGTRPLIVRGTLLSVAN